MSTELRNEILIELKDIIFSFLSERPVKVYLFGSWARGQEKRTSDIDIAIEFITIQKTDETFIMKIRDALEESTIPYRIDVVHLNLADQHIINKVRQEGVLWNDQVKD